MNIKISGHACVQRCVCLVGIFKMAPEIARLYNSGFSDGDVVDTREEELRKATDFKYLLVLLVLLYEIAQS